VNSAAGKNLVFLEVLSIFDMTSTNKNLLCLANYSKSLKENRKIPGANFDFKISWQTNNWLKLLQVTNQVDHGKQIQNQHV